MQTLLTTSMRELQSIKPPTANATSNLAGSSLSLVIALAEYMLYIQEIFRERRSIERCWLTFFVSSRMSSSKHKIFLVQHGTRYNSKNPINSTDAWRCL